MEGAPCATARAKAADDPSSHPLIFADVGDNPGGGGRGNTMWILEAFLAAGVRNGLVGVIHDPALAADAHVHGHGSTFIAHFNRDQSDEFSKQFSAEATVAGLPETQVATYARELAAAIAGAPPETDTGVPIASVVLFT